VINRAFKNIDELRDFINDLDKESRELKDLEELFSLQISLFNEISHCQKMLSTLKELWDIAS